MEQMQATLGGTRADVQSVRTPSLRHHLVTGLVTGQIAGLVMAVVVMLVFTIFLGKGPLFPVQVIGSFLYGDAALHGWHFPSFLAGLLLHQLGPSLFWGVLFGLIVYKLDLGRGPLLYALGAGIGLLSQIVDANVVLPLAYKALWGHNIWAEQVPAFWSWAAHLVFGLGLWVYPWADERLSRRRA